MIISADKYLPCGSVIDKHAAATQAIVFAIDSVKFSKQNRDVAQYMYELLLNPSFAKVPILVLANMQVSTHYSWLSSTPC